VSQQPDDSSTGTEREAKKERSRAKQIISIVSSEDVELFHDENLNAYARLPVNGHLEIWSLSGRQFRDWLARSLWIRAEKAAGSEALSAALNVLRAKAVFEGPEHRLHNRVANQDGSIWYDLSDREWRAVRVTAHGWKVNSQPPIIFRRYLHQRPQAEPAARGCHLTELLQFVNINDDMQGRLLLVYLVSCLVPDIPHPVLVLHGPQGSAKTTALSMLRRLVDPSTTEVLTLHKDGTELVQQLSHHWAPFFDNVNILPQWVSDALCRAVTGDGFSKRQLYTDDDDVIYRFRRCPGISGINVAAYQPDLLDRCIVIGLDRISDTDRRTEQELWEEFEEARPRLVSAMFTVLSGAMARRGSVRLSGSPRMADFAHWGCAIAEALGWSQESFLEAYRDNESLRNDEVLESSSVARAIIHLLVDTKEWEGSPSELLADLELAAEGLHISTRMKEWPKSPSALSRRLNVLRANLARAGIEISVGRDALERKIRIAREGQHETQEVDTVQLPDLSEAYIDTISDGNDEIMKMPSSLRASNHAGCDGNDGNDGIFPTLEGETKEETSNNLAPKDTENAVISVIRVMPQLTDAHSTTCAAEGYDGISDGNSQADGMSSSDAEVGIQQLAQARKLPFDISSWPQHHRDLYEERVAILEYDAGLARDHAEVKAEWMIREMFEKEVAKESGTQCGRS
jgi:hypothetical protein